MTDDSDEPVQTAITGDEPLDDPTSPRSALIRFYEAFNAGDLELMARNWAQRPTVAMDNPVGGITRGWDEIRSVYATIFDGPADVYVEFYDYTVHETDAMFYVVGRERGEFRRGDETVSLAIRTSRIFERIDGEWKQVHHHGSIDDPELLERYQRAVSG